MEKKSLFENLVTERCIGVLSADEVMSDDLKDLETALVALGVKFIHSNTSEKKLNEITIAGVFVGEIDDWMDPAILLPGLDMLPVYVVLKNVAMIFLSDTPKGKVTSIIWKNGGTTNVDGIYFLPLKKYWFKKRRLSCVIDLSSIKDALLEEFSRIEGFSVLYDSYTETQNQKIEMTKEKDWVNAAKLRDQERELLLQIIPLVEENLKTIIGNIFAGIMQE